MPEEKRPTVDASALSLNNCWDEFEHEFIGEPTARATIDNEGNVHVAVYFGMEHWIGDKEQVKPQCVSHAMGWTIRPDKTWTVAEGEATPYRSCGGRECGK